MKFPVFPPILAFFGGETRKNWEKGGLGGGLLAQTAFFSPCCPVYRSMRWLALFSSLLLALWTLPLPIANCRNLCYPISNASNGRPKGAVFETQAAHSLPVRNLFPGTKQSPGQGFLKVFSPVALAGRGDVG